MQGDAAILKVSIDQQTVAWYEGQRCLKVYPISSSQYGIGQQEGSFQTPLGWHMIAEKIGENAPIGTVFKHRQPTGALYDAESDDPEADWILTRIIRLAGLEPGLNEGAGCDSFMRMIYFHGTVDQTAIGYPTSKGCLRMKDQDIIDLFERVCVQMRVYIDA